MYRHVTLRFIDPPLPLVARTKNEAVRIIGHPLKRERDAPFAQEYLFLVRGAAAALDETQKILTLAGEAPPRLDCAEPGARVYQGSLGLPSTGPLKGLIAVLGETLGTVLEHQPLVIESGVLELRLVTIPMRDSALRLRAIEQHAAEAGLGLEIPSHHALTAPGVITARSETLDLLEWEILQALEPAGCYGDTPSADRDATIRELAEALGMDLDELSQLAERAERRVLREAVHAWRRNIRLATPPAPRRAEETPDRQDDPSGSDA